MVGRYLSPRTALLAGMMVSLGACTASKPKIDKHLEDAADRAKAARAVQQGIDREKAPLGSMKRRPGGSQAIRQGESIWMQAGKSRVPDRSLQRDPRLDRQPGSRGVVVLGPRSILVNAKEVPRDEQTQGGGTQASRAGILSSRTFTPPPKMAETTIILWDSANHTDSHTVFVTDFLAEQVLLESRSPSSTGRRWRRAASTSRRSAGTSVPATGSAVARPGITQFMPAGVLEPVQAPPFPIASGSERPTFAFQTATPTSPALVNHCSSRTASQPCSRSQDHGAQGQNAVFQVGGEIPIRIVTSFSAEIEFKAFGTSSTSFPAFRGRDIISRSRPSEPPDSTAWSRACPRS